MNCGKLFFVSMTRGLNNFLCCRPRVELCWFTAAMAGTEHLSSCRSLNSSWILTSELSRDSRSWWRKSGWTLDTRWQTGRHRISGRWLIKTHCAGVDKDWEHQMWMREVQYFFSGWIVFTRFDDNPMTWLRQIFHTHLTFSSCSSFPVTLSLIWHIYWSWRSTPTPTCSGTSSSTTLPSGGSWKSRRGQDQFGDTCEVIQPSSETFYLSEEMKFCGHDLRYFKVNF